MADEKTLHLIVPGICGPVSDIRPLATDSVLAKWVNTLSRARCSDSQSNANDVLAAITGLGNAGDFPTAALSFFAEDAYDSSLFYMHADPVHLRADMDHAVLTSSSDMAINKQESEALSLSLNRHFEQDGLCFITLDENRWLLSCKEKIDLETTPLVDAIGRNINFILPKGDDSTRWRQILTEIQMLMFSHEVNESREARGQLPINSLWFHGCGELKHTGQDDTGQTDAKLTDIDKSITAEKKGYRFCSNDDVIKGLAKYICCDHIGQPAVVDDYLQLLSAADNTVNILHIADLEHLVNYTDVEPWLSQLEMTLNNWVYPLLSFANKNNIKLNIYPCNSKQYQFSRYDNLRSWYRIFHKNKLEHYVSSYSSIER